MAYLAKIQYKYNDLLQNIREDLDADTSYYTKSVIGETLQAFKKVIEKAVKDLPPDAKTSIKSRSKKMVKHISLLLDYINKDPLIVQDYLSYHYSFDENGDIHMIDHSTRVRQTIEEMPRLTRLPRKEDDRVDTDEYSETIEIPMIQHEAIPEADIQNLYDDFVGQINSGLASLGDIKEYPNLLSELYQVIRTQIYVKDRPRILKKLKEMVAQLDDLAYKLSRNPSAQYTISPIKLTDTIKGLYPEEKKTYTQSIVHSKKPKLTRLGYEDLPIMQRDVVDFFETVQPSSDYAIGKSKSDVVSKVLSKRQKKSKLVDEIKTTRKDYSGIGKAEPEMMPEEQAPMPRKRATKKRATKGRKAKDPSDISTWPLPDLKDFMREHGLKGITKKKAEIIDIIQRYIA